MPLVVDQINDMIKAGVPVPEINKFKENKILEMRQADIPPEKISEAFGAVPYDRKEIKDIISFIWRYEADKLFNKSK